MFTIHLKDLQFKAHHGIYDEEKKLGNSFVVNAHVHYLPASPQITRLEQVINYESLFAIIQKRMNRPTPLLETVAVEICHVVLGEFHQAMSVFISVEKLNPPIAGLTGSVAVSFQMSRDNGEENVMSN